MKKRLSLIVGTVVVATVCSFILTGKLIKQNYYDSVTKLNAQPNIKVSLLKYNRGLFHSTAELELTLKDKTIPLRQTITHGPVVAAKTLDGVTLKFIAAQISTTLGDSWQEKMLQYTENKQPIVATTFVDFSNQANTWIKIAPINQSTDTQFHVEWDTITAEFKHDLGLGSYNGAITIPKIAIDKPEWAININDTLVKITNTSQDDLTANTSSIASKNIEFSRQKTSLVQLKDFISELNFTNNEGKLGISLVGNIGNSTIIQQQFAQDSFRLRVNNINSLALPDLKTLHRLNPVSAMILAQQITANSTELNLELPKYFTEALVSYISFEIYRTTPIGQTDARPAALVLQDISNKINTLVQGIVKQKLFIDNGVHYALNVNGSEIQS